MKTAVLILVMVIAASCGKVQPMNGAGQLGTVRALQVSSISSSDAVVFDRICQGLTRKAQKLDTVLPNALSFSVVENDCDGNLVNNATQQVRVEKATTGEFQFRRVDNNNLFVFPKVETTGYGFMKEVCAGATQMPVVSGDAATWIILTGISENDCQANSNEICVVVEKGAKEPNTQNSYRIHTREFVRFNLKLTDGNYGYYTYRKAYATNNCDQGKNTESTATLR